VRCEAEHGQLKPRSFRRPADSPHPLRRRRKRAAVAPQRRPGATCPSAAEAAGATLHHRRQQRTINPRSTEDKMKTLRTGLYPAGGLETGAAILAAAAGVDVSLVQKRLDAFASAHRAYSEAQSAIEAAEAKVRGRQAILTQRDAEQDEALQHLMGALITEGR